mgnify:CR=1 FL=1
METLQIDPTKGLLWPASKTSLKGWKLVLFLGVGEGS